MKNRLFVLGASLLLLSSCVPSGNSSSSPAPSSQEPTPSSSAATELTITDMSGREMTLIPGSFKSIVCVGAGALRLYSYVGDLSLLSGVEDVDNPTAREAGSGVYFNNVPRPYYDAFKDSFAGLKTAGVGGPANQRPEMEKLIECEPDLILSEYSAEFAANMEETIGCPVFNLAYGPKTVFDDNAKMSITKLGQILAREDKATALVNYISDAETDLRTRTADGSSIKAYASGVGNWGQTDYLASHFSFPLFDVTNVTNVLAGSGIEGAGQSSITKDNFVSISEEIDYMFIDASGLSRTLSEYEADKTIFSDVKAVQDGNVYLLFPYNSYYTNLELALIDAYAVGLSVYPDKFSDITLKDKADEIFNAFLGKDLYDVEVAMEGAYGGYQKISDLNAFLDSYLA